MSHVPSEWRALGRVAWPTVLAALACGPKQPPTDLGTTDACAVTTSAVGDSVTLAVRDPWAHGLGETLVWVDCEGRVRAGAASRWEPTDEPAVWRLTLRPGATFWDGTPLSAAAVKRGWMVRDERQPQPWPDDATIEDAVRAIDQRTLEVTLSYGGDSAIRILADPIFAVLKPRTEEFPWPQSTGPYAIDGVASHPGRLVAVPVGSVRGDDLPVVSYVEPSVDGRDDIDGGVGLLLTRDRTVVEYAARVGGYRAIDLPWDHVYALVVPRGTEGAGLRDADFAAAVGAEARPARRTYWWESSCSTPAPEAFVPSLGAENRIAYRRDDPVARALAERLVALARSGAASDVFAGDDWPTALGLSPREFDTELAAGRYRTYVMRRRIRAYDACLALRAMLRAMPWADGGTLRGIVTPVVETRGWALAREGVGPVALDWRGGPYLTFMRRRQ